MSMMNLFSALELGKNSILATQQVFQVIGHNIANVNTDGYSRQTVDLESVAPPYVGMMTSGRGVAVNNINAVRDRFITGQIIGHMATEGYYSSLSNTMSTVEALFSQADGTGLSDQLSTFFNSWADVSNNPTDITSRRSLISSARSFAQNMANSYQSLIDQQETCNNQIADRVDDINALAAEIAGLNHKIAYAHGARQPAYDLLDRRDQAVKSLSNLVGISFYTNEATDSITIDLSGRPLVTDHLYNELSVVRDPGNSNYYDVYIEQYGGPALDMTANIRGGQLEALLTMRDTNIPLYREELDNLSSALLFHVNSLHQTGFALDTVTSGQNFFDMSTGVGQMTAITGTTITFSAAVDTTLEAGDVITVGGQTRRVTAVTAANEVTIDSAFDPDPPAALPSAWEYINTEGAASLLQVNPSLTADPSLIAASGEVDAGPPASGAVGNNEIALAIAKLMEQNNTVDSDRDGQGDYGTLHEYFHRTLSTIGNHSATAQSELEANQSMLTYLENKRDETSAVSLDEETADLMRFEKSYQAIAQFLAQVSELTDIMIQIGRY